MELQKMTLDSCVPRLEDRFVPGILPGYCHVFVVTYKTQGHLAVL